MSIRTWHPRRGYGLWRDKPSRIVQHGMCRPPVCTLECQKLLWLGRKPSTPPPPSCPNDGVGKVARGCQQPDRHHPACHCLPSSVTCCPTRWPPPTRPSLCLVLSSARSRPHPHPLAFTARGRRRGGPQRSPPPNKPCTTEMYMQRPPGMALHPCAHTAAPDLRMEGAWLGVRTCLAVTPVFFSSDSTMGKMTSSNSLRAASIEICGGLYWTAARRQAGMGGVHGRRSRV